MKGFGKRKVALATASELYDNLLNIYTTRYGKFTKAQKTRVKI